MLVTAAFAHERLRSIPRLARLKAGQQGIVTRCSIQRTTTRIVLLATRIRARAIGRHVARAVVLAWQALSFVNKLALASPLSIALCWPAVIATAPESSFCLAPMVLCSWRQRTRRAE